MVRAWIFSDKDDPGGWTDVEPSDLPEAPVLVRVLHSGLNYKDALSLTRRAPISRRFPMVPGVDLVGEVISDTSSTFQPGDKVLSTGYGVGETSWGAFAEQARLKPEWLLPLPSGLTAEQAAAIGTAGLTAAMAVTALERFGIAPGQGQIVVTGPTGGVGSFATWLLSRAGYEVVAVTGRPAEADYLSANGASQVIDRAELEGEPRPLSRERWRAGIDVVGGKVLANMLAAISYNGAVAACGLAGSMDLPGSVAPFILRGVSLLGIDSVMASRDSRLAAWSLLAASASAIPFDRIIARHHFEQVADLAQQLLDQKLHGRAVLSW